MRQALRLQRSSFREEGEVWLLRFLLQGQASTRGYQDSHAICVQHKEPGCGARGVSTGTEVQPTLPSPMAFMPLGWLLPEGDAQRYSTSSNSASETRCPSWTIPGSSAYDQGASQVKWDTSQKLTILRSIVYYFILEGTSPCLKA